MTSEPGRERDEHTSVLVVGSDAMLALGLTKALDECEVIEAPSAASAGSVEVVPSVVVVSTPTTRAGLDAIADLDLAGVPCLVIGDQPSAATGDIEVWCRPVDRARLTARIREMAGHRESPEVPDEAGEGAPKRRERDVHTSRPDPPGWRRGVRAARRRPRGAETDMRAGGTPIDSSAAPWPAADVIDRVATVDDVTVGVLWEPDDIGHLAVAAATGISSLERRSWLPHHHSVAAMTRGEAVRVAGAIRVEDAPAETRIWALDGTESHLRAIPGLLPTATACGLRLARPDDRWGMLIVSLAPGDGRDVQYWISTIVPVVCPSAATSTADRNTLRLAAQPEIVGEHRAERGLRSSPGDASGGSVQP